MVIQFSSLKAENKRFRTSLKSQHYIWTHAFLEAKHLCLDLQF